MSQNSKSKKSWITDPQGIDWEAFYTHGSVTVYGEGIYKRPAPEIMKKWGDNDDYVTKPKKNDGICSSSCAK